ncbi:peptidylprolyl isomerase [Metabacillus litoralis]|uniref:Peptidyl-prolyl cis-trans isomerase n=1 Tax=Metabacillus litoralis TaxID=152268 RepID=A0A5C6W5K4_9BACI|nr:peptidylprolyl isomerase [Metabacillus litoralis]TXC93081.1 peptidylprolyl isomerase [Metabacillus litoralis]
MKKFSKYYSILLLTFLFILTGCGTTDNNQSNNGSTKPAQKIEDNPIVTIEMENNDLIKMELYPNVAPNTVNNFISLVESGFYDGLIFHRVIPDFMIQGGDPEGVGTGGPGYTIKGEFEDNGFENSIKHERGIVSMARSQAPDSAGSQFFIMVAESNNLDGSYAAFGKVIEGMDAVDYIVNVKTDEQDKPKEDQKIKKVTVETFGIDYPEPKKAE